MVQPFFINLANVIFILLITLHEHSECPTALTCFFHDFRQPLQTNARIVS